MSADATGEDNVWIPGDFVMVAGSLASLGRTQEAQELTARGLSRFPRQLVAERFALRSDWPPHEQVKLVAALKAASFPTCASGEDKAGSQPPQMRLPECAT